MMENVAQIQEVREKAKDYLDIIASFSELLKAENNALEEFDTDTVGALYEQKTKLVIAYRTYVAFFIKNQEGLKILDESEKQKLRDGSLHLDELLQKNNVLLQTRMQTSKTIMDSIVNMAKAQSSANSTSYGCQGKYSPLENSKNAIAINRTL